MSRLLTQNLPAFGGNIAASGTASTTLQRNRRIHALILRYKNNANQATIEADITEIRVKVNQKLVRQFSAADVNKDLAFQGIAFSAGLIPIWFTEPKRATPEGSEYLALLSYEDLGVGDVTVEVDFAAGAVAPTLTGRILYDNERPVDQIADILPLGAVVAGRTITPAMQAAAPGLRTVMHWVKKNTNCAAAFPLGAPLSPEKFVPAVNGFLHRMHFLDAVITQVTLRSGVNPFWDADTTDLPGVLLPYGLTKQANTFHVAIDADQQYGNGLYIPSMPDIAVDVITSGAATGNAFRTLLLIRKQLERA